MYYVYILRSLNDSSYYTGHTADLEKRIEEHNQGLQNYTSAKRPLELAWHCAFDSRDKAIAFERYLKSGSGFAFARKRLV